MKLNEINLIPQNPQSVFNLPDFIFRSGKLAGLSEGREIFSSSFYDKSELYYVLFNKSDTVDAYVILTESEILNKKWAVIKRTWVKPVLQNCGYLSGLFKFIQHKLKMSIMSDYEHTPSAKYFWAALSKKFNVKIIDLHSGLKSEFTDTVYNNTHLRLIMECIDYNTCCTINSSFPQTIKITEQIIKDYHYFGPGDI